MEVFIFTKQEIQAQLQRYVEIRLHTDKAGSPQEEARSRRFQDLKVRLTGSEANPIYLIVEPSDPEVVIDRFDGADPPGGERFRELLRRNVR